jgi:hypothetical protein
VKIARGFLIVCWGQVGVWCGLLLAGGFGVQIYLVLWLVLKRFQLSRLVLRVTRITGNYEQHGVRAEVNLQLEMRTPPTKK